jgi:hypothetical protein
MKSTSTILTSDAHRILRVMVRISQQIYIANREDRYQDANSMAVLYGRLEGRQFEEGSWVKL